LGFKLIDVRKGEGVATIDVEALRQYLVDYCGAAMFNGFEAAVIVLAEIESMNGLELCKKAVSLGVDLKKFQVD
jgi:hypothetical protein